MVEPNDIKLKKEVLINLLLQSGYATSNLDLDKIEFQLSYYPDSINVEGRPYPGYFIDINIGGQYIDRVSLGLYIIFDEEYR